MKEKSVLLKELQSVKRVFSFFIGSTLTLGTIVLMLNIGLPARYIGFPVTYAFGSFSLIVFALVYANGFSYLFTNHRIRLKYFTRYIGLLVLLSTTLFLFSYISKDTVLSYESYQSFFDEVDYFSNNGETMINFFKVKSSGFGGGFLGFNIVKPILSLPLGEVLSIAIIVLGYLVGVFIFFFKEFKSLVIKNLKRKKEKATPEMFFETPIEGDGLKDISYEEATVNSSPKEKKIIKQSRLIKKEKKKANSIKISNFDVISEASSLPFEEEDSTISENAIYIQGHFEDENGDYGLVGSFKPVRFVRKEHERVIQEEIKNESSIFDPIQKYEPVNSISINQESIDNDIPVEPMVEEVNSNDNESISMINEPIKPLYVSPEKPVYQEPVTVTPSIKVNEINTEKPVKKNIKWIAPSSELLTKYENEESVKKNIEIAEERVKIIDEFLQDFKIGAKVADYIIGPSVTLYNIEFERTVSSRSFSNYVDDLSRRFKGVSARFQDVVEGSYYSGLEVANKEIATVSFKDIIQGLPDVKKMPLAVAFGKNIKGEIIWADYHEFPHALLAGTSGSGKSVFIHSIITSLIMRNSPNDMRLVLVDPKQVEMMKYRDMPHLLCPVVTDGQLAKLTLEKLCDEMERRFTIFGDAGGLTDLKEYNEYAEENGIEKLPYIIVVIDEYGDLVLTTKGIESPIVRIGGKARAAGIHMLIATQSPNSNVITATIKNNLKTHIALSTASTAHSITILGEGGAEKLLGRGDMLVQSPLVSRIGCVRIQGCFISNKEIMRVVGYLKEHYETIYDPSFLNLEEPQNDPSNQGAFSNKEGDSGIDEETQYQEIKKWVMSGQYTSMSRIQRECNVGFNKAGRLFKRMQDEGIVSTQTEANKGSRVLVHDDSPSPIVTSDEVTD